MVYLPCCLNYLCTMFHLPFALKHITSIVKVLFADLMTVIHSPTTRSSSNSISLTRSGANFPKTSHICMCTLCS